MEIKLFNFWYFIPIIFTIAFVIASYFIFRNKSNKVKKIFIAILLFSNLILHFLKFTFDPYASNISRYFRDVFFINICGVSVLIFPFIFLSDNKGLKDFMFYQGLITGTLAILYPTEPINDHNIWIMDTIRFYYCHIVILIGPLLMVMLGLHKIDYKRIWKMPLYMMGVLLFVIVNQVLQSELGFISLRGDDMFNVDWKNTSLIWGPTDDIAKIFTWLTPDFMNVIPFGEYQGQAKYWPFFYLVPGCIFYYLIIPSLIALPIEFKHIKEDIKNFKLKHKKI